MRFFLFSVSARSSWIYNFDTDPRCRNSKSNVFSLNLCFPHILLQYAYWEKSGDIPHLGVILPPNSLRIAPLHPPDDSAHAENIRHIWHIHLAPRAWCIACSWSKNPRSKCRFSPGVEELLALGAYGVAARGRDSICVLERIIGLHEDGQVIPSYDMLPEQMACHESEVPVSINIL